MIKRLHVKNYRSLRDVELKLGLRNALIGPNMAGKSNLLDSFKFLSSIATYGIKQAILDRSGFYELTWKGADVNEISFSLTVDVPSQVNEPLSTYNYELVIQGSSMSGLITVQRETLTVATATPRQTYTLIDLTNGRGKISHRDGTSVIRDPIDPSTSALELNVPGWEGTAFKQWASLWRFYDLLPPLMKQPNSSLAQKVLQETGGNLSSWMLTLRNTYPDSYQQIMKVAKEAFPELLDVLTPPTQFGTTVLMAKEKSLSRPVLLGSMSHGAITFFALLSLIFSPPELGAPLTCVEEPENHLHPKLLELLIQILTQHQDSLGDKAAQVIITTHSPYLVDKLNIHEVIVIEKSKGETKCSYPSSKDHLKQLLEREELGLGALWYSGALGGR